ncbi:MAG: NAD-dependent malic enzyme [Firmicutes bacterium]|nr:NAD-dependent malic enzyme [Bacillota bacterium]
MALGGSSLDVYSRSLDFHRQLQGKIEVVSRAQVNNAADLSLAYSPGVAEPCRRIAADQESVYDYTGKGNMIAVVSDGSAVLGLGNIGPDAALPVMEGKAVLFKQFAGINAVPICLNTQDPGQIVEIVKSLAPTFAGINLEDISAPRCFEIEERLQAETDMLVFHDDQHGTAVVVLAGLINASRAVGRDLRDLRVVVNGVGAAGSSIVRLLHLYGVHQIIACDKDGAIYLGKPGMHPVHAEIAKMTNLDREPGHLADIIAGQDVFVGVSAPNIVTTSMVRSMNDDPIIFALANPEPEITVELALSAGAKVVASGRSDYPNQVNNVLGFPGIFRGALDVRATVINDRMKIAAAEAIAGLIDKSELRTDYIIPEPFDRRVVPEVATAVGRMAIETKAARKVLTSQELHKKALSWIEHQE